MSVDTENTEEATNQETVEEQQPKKEKTPKAKESKAKTVSKAMATTAENGYIGIDKLVMERVVRVLSLASDATRLQILQLANGERPVREIAAIVKISQPALSHHLSLLRASELVSSSRDGKDTYYRLTKKGSVLMRSSKIVLDFVLAQSASESD